MFGNPNLHGARRNPPKNPYTHWQQKQQKHKNRSWKQEIAYPAVALLAIAIWYLTPISDLITRELFLPQIPLQADYELGRQALAQLPYPDVPHHSSLRLLQQITRDLTQALPKPHSSLFHWDIAVVEADFINAFALPGGVIRVTTQLLRHLQPTKGELAALIGHEMGHVIHRHSQSRMLQSQLAMWVIKALVYDDQDDEQETFGEALGELLAQSAVYLGQQRYSRRDEYEADATSWDLLVHGKYNPQSLHSLLSKLWSLEKSGSDNSQQTSAIQEWTRTHPATKDRLEALDRKWELLPASERRRLARNPI